MPNEIIMYALEFREFSIEFDIDVTRSTEDTLALAAGKSAESLYVVGDVWLRSGSARLRISAVAIPPSPSWVGVLRAGSGASRSALAMLPARMKTASMPLQTRRLLIGAGRWPRFFQRPIVCLRR